jgi:predicted DNA binding CopG/RHH family protein
MKFNFANGKEKKKMVGCYLKVSDIEKIKKIAKANGITPSEVVREIMEVGLKEEIK